MNHDDEKQLRILGKLHYVAAALATVIPLLGAAYGSFGVAILLGKLPGSPPISGMAIGWLPIAMGSFILMIGVAAVAINLVTARSLRERKNHTLCVLTSALNCVHFPLGTLLGAFTISVLCRPAVRAAFELPGPAGSAGDGSRGAPTPPRPGGTHLSSAHGETAGG